MSYPYLSFISRFVYSFLFVIEQHGDPHYQYCDSNRKSSMSADIVCAINDFYYYWCFYGCCIDDILMHYICQNWNHFVMWFLVKYLNQIIDSDYCLCWHCPILQQSFYFLEMLQDFKASNEIKSFIIIYANSYKWYKWEYINESTGVHHLLSFILIIYIVIYLFYKWYKWWNINEELSFICFINDINEKLSFILIKMIELKW